MVNMNCNVREVQSDYNQGIKKLPGLEIPSSLYIVIISNQLSSILSTRIFQRKHSSYFFPNAFLHQKDSLSPKISARVRTDVRSDDEAKILISSKACGSKSLISVQN